MEFITIEQADIQNQEVLFAKLKRACKIGFFYFEMKAEDMKQISVVNTFATSQISYQDATNMQVKSHFCEQRKWKSQYPTEVCELAESITEQGLVLLRSILNTFEVEQSIQDKITGGALCNQGNNFLAFKRYDPTVPLEGLIEHKDFGLLTMLFIDKSGLEVKWNDNWIPIEPKKGYYVINVGECLETILNNKSIQAPLHRVIQIKEERLSFGVFIDMSMKSPVYQLQQGNEMKIIHEEFGVYLKQKFESTYKK